MGFFGRWRHEASDRRRKRERGEEIASWFIFAFLVGIGIFVYRAISPLLDRLLPLLGSFGL